MLAGLAVLLGISVGLARLLLPPVAYSIKRLPGAVALTLLVAATSGAALAFNGVRLVNSAHLPLLDSTRFQWQQITATHAARVAFTEQLEATPLENSRCRGWQGAMYC
ncbi:hypothetical protein HSBAA_15610 [Vreelandella sulfidaeris]|uniref:Uncharacterized protein n=1 Tax=Vreelandella sulfidaeris TaxID=115553 RepID=A0A455U335_9GAMM|nr:hypothetical protein HSBAA_15610 [Halomonas sulfidaeris]